MGFDIVLNKTKHVLSHLSLTAVRRL